MLNLLPYRKKPNSQQAMSYRKDTNMKMIMMCTVQATLKLFFLVAQNSRCKTLKHKKIPFLFQMAYRHTSFIARTVLVQNNDVERACRLVNRIMGKEEMFDQFRRTRFYEKPTQVRRRINYQRCKSVYDEDMNRRIQFLLRQNRTDPYPGCS